MVGTKPTVAPEARASASARRSASRVRATTTWDTGGYLVRGFAKGGILSRGLLAATNRAPTANEMRLPTVLIPSLAVAIVTSCGARTPFSEVEPLGTGGATGGRSTGSGGGTTGTAGATSGAGGGTG